MKKSREYKTVSLDGIANIEGGFSIKPKFDHSMFYDTKYRGYDKNKCRNSNDWMNIGYSNTECGHHEFVAAIKLMEKEGVKFGEGYFAEDKNPLQKLAYDTAMKIRQFELDNRHNVKKSGDFIEA